MPNNTYNDYGTPLSRTELYLQQIAENTSGGGGGGSSGGVLVVNADAQTLALDKTWQEIHDADFAVIKMIPESHITSYAYVSGFEVKDGIYAVGAFMVSGSSVNPATFIATSADGYPSMQMGN